MSVVILRLLLNRSQTLWCPLECVFFLLTCKIQKLKSHPLFVVSFLSSLINLECLKKNENTNKQT